MRNIVRLRGAGGPPNFSGQAKRSSCFAEADCDFCHEERRDVSQRNVQLDEDVADDAMMN